MISILRSLSCALCVLVASAAFAQQPRLVPLRLGETLINLPSQRVLNPGGWEIRFTHRFSTPINAGDAHDLWGLDSSADVGIGLSYAPVRNLQFALYRTDVLDDFEASVKYAAIRQDRLPFSASVRAGVDVRTERNVEDRTSAFAQVVLARQFGQKAEVFVIPTYVTNADLFDTAFNTPVGVAWTVRPALSLILEIIPENTDLPDDVDSSLGWTVGLKRAIGGHWFEVLLSNTRATHVDQYVPSTFLGQGLAAGDIHLGFNIERRFGGRRAP
jgi:hypothetical protein